MTISHEVDSAWPICGMSVSRRDSMAPSAWAWWRAIGRAVWWSNTRWRRSAMARWATHWLDTLATYSARPLAVNVAISSRGTCQAAPSFLRIRPSSTSMASSLGITGSNAAAAAMASTDSSTTRRYGRT